VLDALYYSTVTLTTTGYGHITPVSPAARAVTAFIVTPVRVVFLVVLIGTTLTLLTARYRAARAESRWRRGVKDHTIVIGYGTTGRGAIDSLDAAGTRIADIVVIDASSIRGNGPESGPKPLDDEGTGPRPLNDATGQGGQAPPARSISDRPPPDPREQAAARGRRLRSIANRRH
jgi:voltage-gated potassium channel Kch